MESSGEEGESNPLDVDSPSHSSSPKTQPHAEADTEGTQSLASGGNLTVSPKEDDILTGDQTHTKGQSPASDTSSMTGDMAWLQVHYSPCQEPEDGDTSK